MMGAVLVLLARSLSLTHRLLHRCLFPLAPLRTSSNILDYNYFVAAIALIVATHRDSVGAS